MALVCTLPWPPSANHAWRPTRGGGKILSDKYKMFKQAVGDCVLEQRIRRHWHTDQSLILAVACRPPNRVSFDIDNRLKTLIDSLSANGVIGNDRYVDMIVVRRASLDPPHGSVVVRIEELSAIPITLGNFEEWFSSRVETTKAA